MPAKRVRKLLEHVRYRLEEGPFEVEDGIADFVLDPRPHRADFIRLPEHLHMGCHPLANSLPVTRFQWGAEPGQLLTDAVLVIENAPADRLGWMGGEHRHYLQALQGRGHLLRQNAPSQAAGEHRVQLTLFARLAEASRLPLELGEVDQLEVGGEGTH